VLELPGVRRRHDRRVLLNRYRTGHSTAHFALWKRGRYVVLPVCSRDGDIDWASYEEARFDRAWPRGLLETVERGAPGTVLAREGSVLVARP